MPFLAELLAEAAVKYQVDRPTVYSAPLTAYQKSKPPEQVQFENELLEILLAADVPADDAKYIVLEISMSISAHFRRAHFKRTTGYEFGPRSLNRRQRVFLESLVLAAQKLSVLLRKYPTSKAWAWRPQETSELNAHLQRLIAETKQETKRKIKPGPRPDLLRKALEEEVGSILASRNVEITTYEDGVFARVLQLVHDAIGVPERTVGKSVRRAHAALEERKLELERLVARLDARIVSKRN